MKFWIYLKSILKFKHVNECAALVTILFVLLGPFNSWGQTTYTSNPDIDVFTPCPANDFGTCAGYYIHGGGVLKVKLDNITASNFVFQIKKCSGNFSTSGTAWIKKEGVCGTVVGGPVIYNVGASAITINVPIPPDFCNGTVIYYGIIHVDNGNNEGYYAGPISITASTPPPNLEFTSCINAPSSIKMYDNLNVTYTLRNGGCSNWSGWIKTIIAENNNGANDQILSTDVDIISPGQTKSINTGNDQISLTPGNYSIVSVYSNGPNGGIDNPEANGCSPTTTNSNGTLTHYHPITIDPPCSENGVINITSPASGDFYSGGLVSIQWTGSLLGADCQVNIYYTVNDGDPHTILNNTSDVGSQTWSLNNLTINSNNVKIFVEYVTPDAENNTVFGSSGNFSIYTDILPPILQSPEDGESLNSGVTSVTFTWDKNNPDGVATYEIRLRDTTTGELLLDYLDVGDVNEYEDTISDDLIDGHIYQWVVRATNVGGIAESGVNLFEIGGFGLEMSSPLSFGQDSLYEGDTYAFTTSVSNLGTQDWDGNLYLVVNDVNPSEHLGSYTIAEGEEIDISYQFQPGQYHVGQDVEIELRYQSNGLGPSYLVPVNPFAQFTNPATIDIVETSITLTYPNGPESFESGDEITDFTWTSSGNIQNVSLDLVNVSEQMIDIIATNIQNDGHYEGPYTIPVDIVPGDYKIRIKSYPNGSEEDFSDAFLHISNPESFNLELASGINIEPNQPAMGMMASFEATVINNGVGSFNGTLEMVLQNLQGQDIAVLDSQLNIVLDEGGSMVLSYATDSIISEQGIYRILIRLMVNGGGLWYDVNDGQYLNPINFNILGEGGQCLITNPLASNEEAYEAVQYLCQNGVIQQPLDGDTHPLDPIIKEDLAKVVFLCLYGFDPNTPTPADNFPVPFGDMQDQENQAYARFGKVLSYLEYGDGISPFYRRFFNYNPGSTITRGQVCKVIVEAFDFEKDVFFVPFADVPSTHPEFLQIAKCAELGIVNTQNGNFNPDAFATREQVFIMLHRLMTQCEECTIPEPGTEDFFNPGNYTPANLGRSLSVSDANFDQYSKTSFSIPTRGLPLVFAHNYNSFLTELPDELFCSWFNGEWKSFRPLGPGWSHTYNAYIVKIDGWVHPDGIQIQPDRIAIFWPDGNIHVYEQEGEELSPVTQGVYDQITYDMDEDQYTIIKKNQIVFTFRQLNSANPEWPHVLTEIKDRNNNKLTLHYESYSGGGIRLKEVMEPAGRKLAFSYYPNSSKIYEVKDPMNRKIQFSHGGSTGDDIMSYKFFEGTTPLTTNYNYFNEPGKEHLLRIITLPNGNFVNNEYEQRKLHLTSLNGELGAIAKQQVSWSLSAIPSGGTVSSVTTEDFNQTYTSNYKFNELGKVMHMTTPTNTLDNAEYDDSQNPTLPTSVTIDDIITQYTYDVRGNVLHINQPLGVEHEFEYNTLNDIEQYTNPRNHTTDFGYTNGNLTSITAPIGTTTMTYNSYGQVKTITNPEGITVTYEYDGYGNAKATNGPLSISSQATYDLAGRVKTSEDPNGHSTQFSYYDRDFVKDITDPMEYVTQYLYDPNGNLTDVINAKGNVTHMEYDYFDWLNSVQFEGDKKTFFYDLEGKLTKIKKPDGEFLQYNYHPNGNLKNNGYASFTYDSKNRLKTVTKDSKTLTFGYDNLHRIISTNFDSKTVQYEYDQNNNVKKIVYPVAGKEVNYTYDANDRMKTVEDWNGNTTEYFYLNDGRLEHISYPNGVISNYFYDNAGRMDSAVTRLGSNIITSYGYVLAPNGNHLGERKTEPFPDPTFPATSITSTYNDDNTIATSGSTSYAFDDNGNMISEAGRFYSWDDHNLLIGIAGDITATFAYDGLGNRRSSVINGTGKKYVLDILGMSQILMETDLGGNPENYYVYGLGLISRIKPDNSTRYYHGDFRGSTIAMTDNLSTITHKYKYDSFGNILNHEEEDSNAFKFVGIFGLTHVIQNIYSIRFRYYHSTLGRFISEDAIWKNNLYVYANNNPTYFVDINGASTIISPILSIIDQSINLPNWINASTNISKTLYYDIINEPANAAFYRAKALEFGDKAVINSAASILGDRIIKSIEPGKWLTKQIGKTTGFALFNMSYSLGRNVKVLFSELSSIAFGKAISETYNVFSNISNP
ncbi:MAG: RHS repeat-associated core domain-containing protein [Saprospiraceae bacterium]